MSYRGDYNSTEMVGQNYSALAFTMRLGWVK